MTYEDICKKLGFDPFNDKYPIEMSDHEDDRYESPFRKLTLEESNFLVKMIVERDKASGK